MTQRCLYEVLGVAKDADDDAIKKAYRKQALVWHPDKNAHRPEEANLRFKEISNAYEVLSDKHERAWYDSHRDQILRSGERHQAGSSSFAGGERPSDEPDLFQYFSSSCYSGFGEGPKGFYAVYGDLFSKLATQETAAFEGDESNEGREAPPMPPFGGPNASAVEVNAFYASWGAFTTFKSFAWADQYNPATAPNRQVRRRMDEENRKARKAARRDYIDNVRELVAFVKKRDKRVAKFQAEEAARRAAREAEDAARRAAEKEERLKRAAEWQEPEWAREAETMEAEEEAWEDAAQPQLHECLVCDKTFRSEKALANHERSRKHMEALAALKEVLQEEEAWILEGQEAGTSEAAGDAEAAGGAEAPAVAGGTATEAEAADHNTHQGAGSVEAAVPHASSKKKKGAKQRQQRQQQQQPPPPAQPSHEPVQVSATSADATEDKEEEAVLDEDELLARLVAGSSQKQRANGSSTKAKQRQQQHKQLQQEQQEVLEEEEQSGSSSDANSDVADDEVLARMMAGTSRRQQQQQQQQQQGEESTSGSDDSEHASARSDAEQHPDRPDSADPGVDADSSGQEVEEEEEEGEEADEAAMLARLAASHAASGRQRQRPSSGRQGTTAAARASKSQQQQDLRSDGEAAASAVAEADARSSGQPAEELEGLTLGGTKGGRRRASKSAAAATAATAAEPAADDWDSDDDGRGRSKAKTKRQQRAAQKEKVDAATKGLLCGVCGGTFPTRNQLFKHIQATGHAMLK